MMRTAELRTKTGYIVIVEESLDAVEAVIDAIHNSPVGPVDTQSIGCVDSDDIGYVFDSISFHDWAFMGGL